MLSSSTLATAVIDCSQARNNMDKLMCSNTELGQLDDQMVRVFREAFFHTKEKQSLLEQQRDWIRNVRDLCNDTPCLRKAYSDRIDVLQGQ